MANPVPCIVNIINSGPNSGIIGNGDIVFLSANKLGITQVKKTIYPRSEVIVPSGTYGFNDYGALGNRFRHPGTDVTTV